MNRRALLALPPLMLATHAAPALAGGPGGGSTSQASYFRIGSSTANAPRSGGRAGIMTVETGLDVPDAALRARAEQAAPRLRAAYAAVTQRAARLTPPHAAPDVARLSAELQATTDRILGRAGARLLLGSVMVV